MSSHHIVVCLCLIYFLFLHLCTGFILTGSLHMWISLANLQLLQHYIWKVHNFGQGSTEFVGIAVNVVNTIGAVYNHNRERQTMLATLTAIFSVATFLYENIGIMARCVEFQNRWKVLCEVQPQLSTCDEHLCMEHHAKSAI